MLLVTSPEKNSGKTTLLDLIKFLTPNAMVCVGVTEAALFRGIELWDCTLIIDEADTILIDNEPLRAVINTGWTRGSGVPRCLGDEKVPHPVPDFLRQGSRHERQVASRYNLVSHDHYRDEAEAREREG